MMTETELPELRRNPEPQESIYVVYDPRTFQKWSEYYPTAQAYAARGYDVVLRQSYNFVEVDGITYKRRNVIASPHFYTLKEDFTHSPDTNVFWDSPFEYRTKCEHCEEDWQMNEAYYLRFGEILCEHCGRG